MDILESFVLDGQNHEVKIIWEDQKPLFLATDIARILNVKNVSSSVSLFDEDEKVLRRTETLGGLQFAMYFTECGMYRFLMLSKKPIARPFQKWVTSVLLYFAFYFGTLDQT